jgi:hypothetical protein
MDNLDLYNSLLDHLEPMAVLLRQAITDLGTPTPAPPTTYAQRDPRWASVKLGFGNTTIGQYGCVLCCLAMASERATLETLLPPDANELIKSAGGYTGRNLNLVQWAAAGGALGLTYNWSERWRSTPADVGRVQDTLAPGKFVLLQMDFDTSDDDLDEHWVLVRESLGDGRFLIDDPWTGKAHEFPPAYCRSGWSAERAIYGAVCYSRDRV